jgi:hypothetical protein
MTCLTLCSLSGINIVPDLALALANLSLTCAFVLENIVWKELLLRNRRSCVVHASTLGLIGTSSLATRQNAERKLSLVVMILILAACMCGRTCACLAVCACYGSSKTLFKL